MGQSLAMNYVHIVFSTKYRQPLIFPWIEEELFEYIGGICNKLECQSLAVGGHYDHVHILCALSKKIPLMKLLEVVKGNSSLWIKSKGREFQDFYWQNGYAAFSVNPRGVERVRKYIEGQAAHHAHRDFKLELIALLEYYGMDYDECYLWD
jgi:putative transposase